MNQRTYVMLKPDAYQRKLMGKIITRIEEKGWVITNMKMMRPPVEVWESHYAHHSDKPFFPNLINYLISGPVVGMIVEGDEVIEGIRSLMGPTKWSEASPGTIRGDFANSTTYNLIHGSDSVENAEIEIKRFFG